MATQAIIETQTTGLVFRAHKFQAPTFLRRGAQEQLQMLTVAGLDGSRAKKIGKRFLRSEIVFWIGFPSIQNAESKLFDWRKSQSEYLNITLFGPWNVHYRNYLLIRSDGDIFGGKFYAIGKEFDNWLRLNGTIENSSLTN